MKFKFTFLFLTLLGMVFISILIHEGVHIIQSKEPYSVCWDVRQKSVMHVQGIFPETKLSLEVPALIVQGLVLIMIFVCIYIDFKERNRY